MEDQPQPRKLFVNGTELHYIEQGHGAPLVLVHGSVADFRSWGAQIEPYSQHYRVIAYSRRYHYPNAWTGNGTDYSATLHADDLAMLVSGLELEPVHIVAQSYGAYVALFAALRHPDLVRTLVLNEPPVWPLLANHPQDASGFRAFMAQVREPAGEAFQRGDVEQGLRLFIDGVVGAGTFAQLPPPVRAMMLDNAPSMKAETSAHDMYTSFTCEDAQRIEAPILLVTGERSLAKFHLVTDELERCLPHKERVMIPDASHGMFAENPQAYNEAVLAFLAKH